MELFLKKWIFLSFLVLATPIFAEHASNSPTFAFAELLMWQMREANADNWAQILYPAPVNEPIQFMNVPFKWNPGLRVGAGFSSKEHPWNYLLYYTGYKTQGNNYVRTDLGEIHSAFSSNFYANNPQGNGISGPYYHQAGIQWDLIFNTLDLELGSTITVDKLVIIRPFTGLKAASIDQTILTNWGTPYQPTTSNNPNPTPVTTFSFATETIVNNFTGLGPSAGMDTTWHLYVSSRHTLNLIGNFSGAFLWSKWKFRDIYQNNAAQTISTMNDSLSSSATMAKAYLGMQWSGMMKNIGWAFNLGYEEQVWFNQLQYYSFDMGKTNDALYLQGAVLGFDVHF